MPLVLLTGGARSGKSTLAVQLAQASGLSVTVVATGEPRDAEFAARIANHRRTRPRDWTVIEEPVDLVTALAAVPPSECVLIDCLSLWSANLLDRGVPVDDVLTRSARAAGAAAARLALTVVVTNEVGSGIVPESALARAYRDLLGQINAQWASLAERVALVVAGRALPLIDAAEWIEKA
jgi:adenosylcobinamide kinase / adenosylcobinamide-phosphate guanylyltransferase